MTVEGLVLNGTARIPIVGSPVIAGFFVKGAQTLTGNGTLHHELQAALVEAPVGKGRVVLFAFRPQFRGQPHATFKVLFNALLLPSS